MDLLKEAIPLLDRLSGDRIRHELDHILVEATASQILSRLQELNLLTTIEPALVCDDWLIARLETLSTFQPEDCWNLVGYSNDPHRKRDLSYTLWFIRLSSEELQRVINRLRIPTNLVNVIFSANDLWRNREVLTSASSSDVVSVLDAVPPLSRFGFFLALSDNKLREVIHMYITRWQYITPTINGHDLEERGVPPGPIYREILTGLRAAWVDGDITSKEEESTLLEELLQDRGSE
jgi:tRNA nucleotidyltransferase (CCA-adding enzyme)